jgi:site-specific DNA recombinase
MATAAIYARVSSARQAKDETIASQTLALREHAHVQGLDVPEEWVFEDAGHSGATLVRPGLEQLRDLAAQGVIDVVLVYSPDRLARKFAYQALLIEEFARSGVAVRFVKGPRGDSPEDQLMVQFQGMFAEYEKAQLAERYRRGKAYRAKTGSVNVLSGAPFGYRYIRKTPDCGARYEVIEHEAALVTELFRRYADEGATVADLTRWLTSAGIVTRTGKSRWDRSVIWGMLRNPAYAGRAVFGKTMAIHEQPGLNRVARLQGRATPRAVKTVDRPQQEWTEITVPAIVDAETFDRVQARLAGNKRFATRASSRPSLLQGMAACSACGYAYYRTSTRTTNKKIFYYRCLGSDGWRYEGGRVCTSPPVRADYLDQVVWEHITGLLADPALIRAEIDKRLATARTSDPVIRQRKQLQTALAKASKAITAMIEAYQEQLITIDELRSRMPHLRATEAGVRAQLDAAEACAADRDAYLKLAGDLEDFLAQLRTTATTASTDQRRRVIRLVIKDVLIGPEKITIRHRIPTRADSTRVTQHDRQPDTEGDTQSGCQLRWGRARCPLRGSLPACRPCAVLDHSRAQPFPDEPQDPLIRDAMLDELMHPPVVDGVVEATDVRVEYPVHLPLLDPDRQRIQRVMRAAPGPEPVRETEEVHLVDGVQHRDDGPLEDLVLQAGDAERPQPPVRLRDVHPARWLRPVGAAVDPIVQVPEVSLQVLPVGTPRHAVRARGSPRAQRPVGSPQAIQRDMVQQRREPRSPVLPCNPAHTLQRT